MPDSLLPTAPMILSSIFTDEYPMYRCFASCSLCPNMCRALEFVDTVMRAPGVTVMIAFTCRILRINRGFAGSTRSRRHEARGDGKSEQMFGMSTTLTPQCVCGSYAQSIEDDRETLPRMSPENDKVLSRSTLMEDGCGFHVEEFGFDSIGGARHLSRLTVMKITNADNSIHAGRKKSCFSSFCFIWSLVKQIGEYVAVEQGRLKRLVLPLYLPHPDPNEHLRFMNGITDRNRVQDSEFMLGFIY